MPGVFSAVNSELSLHDINISGQYLKTKDEIGSVVLDIENKASDKVAHLLGKVKRTIKVWALY